ncbi:hypothetical protein QT359_22600, partial [Xanthomonas citri pv. citri]
MLADLAANDRKLRGGIGMLEAPVGRRICTEHGRLERLRQCIGRTEGGHLVFGNRNAFDMLAPDDRPTGVTPTAQALKLLGGDDVFGRDKA